MVKTKKTPNLERKTNWHLDRAKAAQSEVAIPKKTEMPMSRSASCVRSSEDAEADSMYE